MPPLIPLTGTGGLFTRIGALGGLLNCINLSRGTTVVGHVASIQSQYQTTNQDVIDNLYANLLSYQNSCSSFNSPIKSIAAQTIIEMANASLLLSNAQINTALIYLISQMQSSGQTVNRCTVTSNWTAAGSNIGNPNVVMCVNDVNNALLEYSYSEGITAVCTRDSQSNPGLAGIEQISISTQMSVSDSFSWMFPEGSGVSLNVQAVAGTTSGSGGAANWLINGSMESWSPTASGIPVGWHVETGTLGTTILQSSSPVYDGTYALQYLGNGSENTAIYQRFSTAAAPYDTNALAFPNTLFAVNMWVRVDATPAAGVLRVALWNGSSVILDNSGAPNSFNINLTTLSTTWIPFSGIFRVPNLMPANVSLELKLTTALTSGRSVYVDRVAMCQPTQLYRGGPLISIFSGNVNLIRNDTFWISIYNNYGGAMQTLFGKIFNMPQLGLILPSSLTPTVPDSLIM
jgi:hypothetical protein